MLPDSSSAISVGRRLGDAVEQVVGRHHQPRRAEPALHRAGVDERPLDVGRRSPSSAMPSIVTIGTADGAGRQHEARAHQLAVDEHAARAALPLLARPLGAVQPEPLAQHVEQALAEPRVGDVVVDAVDVQRVVLSSLPGSLAPDAASTGNARRSSRRASTSIECRR